jgi:predicted outer membrane repeat protein
MVRRAFPALLVFTLSIYGCSDDDPSDRDGGATVDTGGSTDGNKSTDGKALTDGKPSADKLPPKADLGPPIPTACTPLKPKALSSPTEVSTEAALRTALAKGGQIRLKASITAKAALEVKADTVLDGGGFSINGGGTTHLFHGSRVHFTLQNATLKSANNKVADSEHFSRRSGAAVMLSGGGGNFPSKLGSFTAINVTFDSNKAKPTGPGDIRGGAVHLFALPDSTISGCTFTNNTASNGGALGGLGSSIEIINTRFVNNATNGTGPGGALEGVGGAISLDALSQNGKTAYLKICGSEFSGNRAKNGGGAIYLVTHWYRGNVFSIDQSLFSDNRSTSTAEGQGGAIFTMDDNKHTKPSNPVASKTSISNSLFVNNQTWGSGGGVWFWTEEGRLTLTNVTFSANSVSKSNKTSMGGALAISRGPTTIVNCTFADNYAKFHGGGIQMGGSAKVTMKNSLFSNNLSNRDGGWANFQTNRAVDTDGGGNMQWLDPAKVIDSNSNKLVSSGAKKANPKLAALADNGGPTKTRALPKGSPAIDAGVKAGAPTVDQRGKPRDAKPDLGAYELQ